MVAFSRIELSQQIKKKVLKYITILQNWIRKKTVSWRFLLEYELKP